MFDIRIMLLFVGLPIGLLVFAYVVFPRKTKNFFMQILPAWNKRYVICHLIHQAGLSDEFRVIPNMKGLTKVGNFNFLLCDRYVALIHKNRKHFVLDESNTIPKTFVAYNMDDIIFQTAEIKTALDNNVMEWLFTKKKEMLIIGLFIVAIIATLAITYNIIQLNEIKSIIQIPVTTIQTIIPGGK